MHAKTNFALCYMTTPASRQTTALTCNLLFSAALSTYCIVLKWRTSLSGTSAYMHTQSDTGRQRWGAVLASGTGKHSCLGSGLTHPVLKPNLTPEETPAMPAGSNLSLPAATPRQTAAPWSWDHHNTSRLLKIEAVTETCHAILLHSGHNAHLNIFVFKYFYNSNNNCCRQSLWPLK